MKKVSIIVLVIVAYSFSSCRKDRTCICKSGTLQVAEPTSHKTKKNAKKDCRALEESYRNKNADVTCELE